jgi:hypothetical protein
MTFAGTGRIRNFGLEKCPSQVTFIFYFDSTDDSQEIETVTNCRDWIQGQLRGTARDSRCVFLNLDATHYYSPHPQNWGLWLSVEQSGTGSFD